MEIVDTHIHLWSPETHPWVLKYKDGGFPFGKLESILTYLVEDYKKDIEGHNVVQCVHVEVLWPGEPVGETAWVNQLAESTGVPNASVGFCDLSSNDVEDVLKRHCEYKRFRGIRQILNYHEKFPEYSFAPHDNYLTDPNWIRGFSLLEKYNLSFEMQVFGCQMQRAAAVIRDHPGVMVMLDHCGLPYMRDPESMKQWREGLEVLAECPNMYVKVSGMFATDPKWDQRSIETVVKPVLEIFGIDRCVFASDFPVNKINGTYTQLLAALELRLCGYSQEDKQKFFAGNARKFYRL